MFPQTKSVFKAARVLGVTRKQLPVEFQGFQVFMMLPETIMPVFIPQTEPHSKASSWKKKLFFFNLKKVMKNSHAANKHKNTQNTHKSQKQFHISRPETFLIRNNDSTP